MTRHGPGSSAAFGNAVQDAAGAALEQRKRVDTSTVSRKGTRGAALPPRTCAAASSWLLLLRCALGVALVHAASALAPPLVVVGAEPFYAGTSRASLPHAARTAVAALVLAVSLSRAAAQTARPVLAASWKLFRNTRGGTKRQAASLTLLAVLACLPAVQATLTAAAVSTSGTWNVPNTGWTTGFVTIYAVGGGGGGGGTSVVDYTACGGGAGGVAYATVPAVPGDLLTIQVGAGGAGGAIGSQAAGGNGGSTVVTFGSRVLTANGGTGGNSYGNTTRPGGGSFSGGDGGVAGGAGSCNANTYRLDGISSGGGGAIGGVTPYDPSGGTGSAGAVVPSYL